MRLTIAGLRACAVVAALAGASPAAWAQLKDSKAHFWVEVSDTILTPGESVEFTIWMEFEPKAPAIVFYAGADRQIAGFGRLMWGAIFLAQVENGVIGAWNNSVWHNPDFGLTDYDQLPNKIDIYRLDNFHPYENPEATKANPLWLLNGKWTPGSYESTTVVFDLKVWEQTLIAAYTPPNNMAYPWFPVQYYTSHTPTTIKIRPEACVADCDASGSLDIDDFVCFQTCFAVGDMAADCDGDGQLLIDDFICFQTSFAIGC
jgi:hypothetical protein